MNLTPVLRHRYFDANGNPLAGGKLYSYQAGTTTPQATYTDQAGGTPNANPVVLDANGEAAVWIDPELSYKFVLHNSDDVLQWTVDNVVALIDEATVSTQALQDDSVTAVKLRDSASVDSDRAVTTNHIRNYSVSKIKQEIPTVTTDGSDPGIGGVSVSADISNFSEGTGTYTDVPQTATLTTMGRPVKVELRGKEGALSYIGGEGPNPGTDINAVFYISRGATIVNAFHIKSGTFASGSTHSIQLPPACMNFTDTGAVAGSNVYKISAAGIDGSTARIVGCNLIAYEI